MIALPPELAPWAELLDHFAPDLQEAVGVLARRLSTVMDRVRPRPRPRGDDPDGYGGLARRGPYDRLLLSEWAVAAELPDEFTRRAAMGEHAFLELDRRTPAQAPRVVALFDAGPDQLGAPRVVQLAALVVLARRAMAAGGSLHWGILQEDRALQTTLDKATAEAFLAGRTAIRASAEHLTGKRRERLGKEWDELWIVGNDPMLEPRAIHLSITDVIAPDARQVDIRLDNGGRLLGQARLDLPAPELGRRLLTAPFRVTPAPTKVSPTKPPADTPDAAWAAFPKDHIDPRLVRFIPGTRQLLVVFADNRMCTWSFPLDGTRCAPKPRVHPRILEPIVAIGYSSQRVVAVTRPERELRVGNRKAIPVPYEVPLGWGSFVHFTGVEAFTDKDGRLYEAEPWTPPAESQAVALFSAWHHLYALERRGEGLTLRRFAAGRRVEEVELGCAAAWIGARNHTHPDACRVLGRGQSGLSAWNILPPAEAGQHAVLTPAPVHGRCRDVGSAHVVGVGALEGMTVPVVWEKDQNRFRNLGTGPGVIPTRTPINPCVSPTGNEIAWHTAEGFLEVWSLTTGKPLLLRHAG